MGAPVYQPTFTGGELSPGLWARVDLARYGTSFRTGKNFIVRPYGGIVNRPGLEYVGDAVKQETRSRLIPFEFSSEVAYVIEMGDHVMRFIYRGAYVLADSPDIYNPARNYALGDLTSSAGIVYRSLQNGNIGHTPASSPTWWEPNPLAEVASPYSADEIADVTYTQSADIVYLAHTAHKPQELRRVSAGRFQLLEFANKNGPFAPINSDEAVRVAVSAETGNVYMTSSGDVFTEDMVGSLFYVEEKDLRDQRPWEVSWRNVVVNALTRSDGKVYRASTVPAVPSGGWIQTGSVRPVHEMGRAWDGPGDTRTTGTTNYAVGVEWEYLHSGFGIVLITGYTSPTQVTGTVTSRVPKSCVGGIGGAGATWNFVGDGSTLTFSLTSPNNVSNSASDYTVTLNGSGVQSNPYYTPPPGTGGGGRPGGGNPASNTQLE